MRNLGWQPTALSKAVTKELLTIQRGTVIVKQSAIVACWCTTSVSYRRIYISYCGSYSSLNTMDCETPGVDTSRDHEVSPYLGGSSAGIRMDLLLAGHYISSFLHLRAGKPKSTYLPPSGTDVKWHNKGPEQVVCTYPAGPLTRS